MYHRFSEVRQYLISVLGVPYYETEECILFLRRYTCNAKGNTRFVI